MRKLLYLASFTAQTGDLKFEEKRLLLIEEEEGDTDESMRDRAFKDLFMPWFRKTYVESKLLSFICHETISKDNSEVSTRIFQIKWTASPDENTYTFYIGDDSGNIIIGASAITKEKAAMDFLEKLMIRNDLMVIQYH